MKVNFAYVTHLASAFLLSFVVLTAKGQSADVTEGCAPLAVNFTPPGAHASYYWDLGNGTTSTLENPTTSYISNGVFTVEFSETFGGPVLGSLEITVYNEPVLSVVPGDTQGCTPFNVEFTASITKDDAITSSSFNWVFGDGTSEAGTEVQGHIYNDDGTYNVSLSLETNMPTCDVTQVFSNLVEAVDPPMASFTATALGACTAPLSVDFTNTSTGDYSPGYEWDFGDGSPTSSDFNTSHEFTSEGSFEVVLTATNTVGCSANFSEVVAIGSPTAVINVADELCKEADVTFEYLDASSVQWDFGGDVRVFNAGTGGYDIITTSNERSLVAGYIDPGIKTITLTINNGGCGDVVQKDVEVHEVAITAFSVPDEYSCDNPIDVNYQASTPAGDPSYEWTFHDNSTAAGASVFYEYYAETDDQPFGENEEVLYDTYVIATSGTTGCHDTAFVEFTHFPVNAKLLLESENFSGCAPLNLIFNDTSASYAGDPIIAWRWNMGDGTTINNTNDDDVNHTFTTVGDYEVTLEVETASGCIKESYPVDVAIGDTYDNADLDFVADQLAVCAGETVEFTVIDEPAGVDGYHYYTEGNRSFHQESESTIAWTYNYETGPQDVSLMIDVNGCFSTVTKTDYVTVNGAVAAIDYEGTCADPFDKQFTSLSNTNGTMTLDWDFGDGNNSATDNPLHTYAAQNTYTVTLTATETGGSGCPATTDEVDVLVVVPDAVLNAPTTICEGADLILDASGSTGVGCRGYSYRFPTLDGVRPVTWDQDSYTFTVPEVDLADIGVGNTETFELVVTDDLGCTSSTSVDVTTNAIHVDGMADVTEACLPQEITLTSDVTSDAPIVSYLWTLSNGQSFNTEDATFTLTDAPADGNTFFVSLEVEDDQGCSEGAGDNLLDIDFYELQSSITGDTEFCAPITATFEATDDVSHGSFLTFDWDFGNGDTGTLISEETDYTTEGDYTITLTVTEDATSCVNTFDMDISAQVYPVADILTDVDGFPVYCNPQTVNFTNNSTETIFSEIVNVDWDFGNGETSTTDAYTLTYPKGSYDVSLEVSTSFGCADTDNRNFEVVGPEGTFNIDTDLICKGESITFAHNDDLVDVDEYDWFFGDGNSATDVSPIEHTYEFIPESGQTVAFLILSSGQCEAIEQVTINFHDVEAGFIRNDGIDTSLCIQDNIFPFTSTAVSATDVFWDFGDNSTMSTEINPDHTYAEAGTYLVTQTAENSEWGCVDGIQKYVIISSPPETEIIMATDTVCAGAGTQLSVAVPSENSTYQWSPQEIMSDANASTTHADPDESLEISVLETDANGCQTTVSDDLFLVNRYPFEDWEETIKLGETVTLPIEYDDNYIFTLNHLDSLSCTDCDFPEVTPGDSIVFTLIIEDPYGCFQDYYDLTVNVIPPAFVSMPGAFSPNNDGINDIMFIGGRFLRELLDFKIFNRWGQELFSANSFEEGWDGRFNGELQKPDIYVYKVRAIGEDGEMVVKEGYLNLIR